jgi:hypothetical protein
MRRPVAWKIALEIAAGVPDVAELAEALDADRVDVAIDLRDQDHVDLRHIGVDRHPLGGGPQQPARPVRQPI